MMSPVGNIIVPSCSYYMKSVEKHRMMHSCANTTNTEFHTISLQCSSCLPQSNQTHWCYIAKLPVKSMGSPCDLFNNAAYFSARVTTLYVFSAVVWPPQHIIKLTGVT